MSRSIHRTRRDLANERRWQHPHDPGHLERTEGILRALSKKRALKRKSAELRKQEERPLHAPPRSADSIPIRVTDGGPQVHHHASPDDVRAILRALPEGTSTGIESIELCLGKWDCAELVREDEDEDGFEPDPFTGRLGTEFIPGVYCGPLLGKYRGWNGKIWILAFVHEALGAGRERPPELGLYLRLRQLATLVHEVAHHDDSMLRTARASEVRTRSRSRKGEAFARRRERQWVREIVVPYLERAYPDQVRAWEAWMEGLVGIPLPLRTLAHDVLYPDIPWSHAYEDFLRNVMSGRDALESRIEFADELHYNWLFDLSLVVTRSVLAQHPDHLGARALEADVLRHLDRLDEAQASASMVLDRDDAHSRAWDVQLLIHEKRRDWRALAEAALRAREIGTEDDAPHFAAREALAHVHLGGEEAFAACLAVLRARGDRFSLGKAAWLEVRMKLRLARFEEVLELAAAVATQRIGTAWLERIEACRILALVRLERKPPEIRVRERVLDVLRSDGFDEWADELARLRTGRGPSKERQLAP